MMRQVTPDEVETWTALARQYGFVNAGGQIELGRYVVEQTETGQRYMKFITPLPAGLEEEDLRAKAPPILFDRTPPGEIILSGRWWQLVFERLSEPAHVRGEMRQKAALAARTTQFEDLLLPADTDTITFLAPDRTGNLIVHEALPPGTTIGIRPVPT